MRSPTRHHAPVPPVSQAGARSGANEIEALYARYFDFVWRNVRRMGVPAEALDDAVQDVFLVVHRRIAEFEGRSAVETWLFGILVRVAKDHRRSFRRRLARLGAVTRLASADEADAREGPLDAVSKRQAVRLLHALLDRLADDKRAIFVLVELEGAAVTEASQALGINLNTAYARLRAARREFEEALARHRALERRGET